MSNAIWELGLQGFRVRVYGLAFRALGVWEFPKIRGTLFWGPCNKDPTV